MKSIPDDRMWQLSRTWRVPTINTSPFAELMLLALFVLSPGKPQVGFMVKITPIQPDLSCPDVTPLVASLREDRSLWLNRQPEQRSSFSNEVKDIFKTRSEKVLSVYADPKVSYGEVVKIIEMVAPHASQVTLLTSPMDWNSRCFKTSGSGRGLRGVNPKAGIAFRDEKDPSAK